MGRYHVLGVVVANVLFAGIVCACLRARCGISCVCVCEDGYVDVLMDLWMCVWIDVYILTHTHGCVCSVV